MLIWENLDERMELLGHLRVIVPIGINFVEFGRTKENQSESHIQKETVLAKEAANVHEVFSRQQICPSMFLLEGTDHRG